MNHRLEIEGVDASDLVDAIAAAVLDRLRPVLAESSAPMLVDRDEMARLSSISSQMVDKLRAAGTVPSVMAGRRRLYCPADVIAALKSEAQSDD